MIQTILNVRKKTDEDIIDQMSPDWTGYFNFLGFESSQSLTPAIIIEAFNRRQDQIDDPLYKGNRRIDTNLLNEMLDHALHEHTMYKYYAQHIAITYDMGRCMQSNEIKVISFDQYKERWRGEIFAQRQAATQANRCDIAEQFFDEYTDLHNVANILFSPFQLRDKSEIVRQAAANFEVLLTTRTGILPYSPFCKTDELSEFEEDIRNRIWHVEADEKKFYNPPEKMTPTEIVFTTQLVILFLALAALFYRTVKATENHYDTNSTMPDIHQDAGPKVRKVLEERAQRDSENQRF